MASPQLRHVAQRARLGRAEKRSETRHNFHGPCKTSGKQRQKNIRISPGRNRQKKLDFMRLRCIAVVNANDGHTKY